MSAARKTGVSRPILLLLAILPALLLLAGCDACKQFPRYHLVVGDPTLPAEKTYNVLFVGSGFRTKPERKFYRWAVHELASSAAAWLPSSEIVQAAAALIHLDGACRRTGGELTERRRPARSARSP